MAQSIPSSPITPISSTRLFVDPRHGVLRLREHGTGEPVLLLHGLFDALDGFWESAWSAALGQHRLVAYDARGHGVSPPRRAGESDTLAVDDALRVLDGLAIDRAHVVGYSMGGWTAMNLALRAPHRVASLAIGGAQPFGQSLAALRHLVGRGMPAVVDVLARSRRLSPETRARLLANDPVAIGAIIAGDRAPLPEASLRQIDAPTLLWVGSADPIAPAVERFGGILPRARVVSCGGADHFAAFDDPRAIAATRDHLARCARIASTSKS